MDRLTLQQTFQSQFDKTRKLVYLLNDGIARKSYTIEVGVIDKGDGKDILCIPTQTNCAQACRFCHSNELAGKVLVRNLEGGEIAGIVQRAWADAGLAYTGRPLLVSFMGLGEPLANVSNLVFAMMRLHGWAFQAGLPIRFGLATMLPERLADCFKWLTEMISGLRLPLKVHLSLHHTRDEERREWMPAAASIKTSIDLLAEYHARTLNPVEIHYTLIAGVNDFYHQRDELINLLKGKGITVKFLHYNPGPNDTRTSPTACRIESWRMALHEAGIETEYYRSPGEDIAACCGAFMSDLYVSTKEQEPFGVLLKGEPIGMYRHPFPYDPPPGSCVSGLSGEPVTLSNLVQIAQSSPSSPKGPGILAGLEHAAQGTNHVQTPH